MSTFLVKVHLHDKNGSGSGVRTHDAFRQEKFALRLKPPVLTTSLYRSTHWAQSTIHNPGASWRMAVLLIHDYKVRAKSSVFSVPTSSSIRLFRLLASFNLYRLAILNMFVRTAFIALAVAPFAFAQNNAVELQSIIAQFTNAGLTPE